MIDLDALEAISDLATRTVDVPEWKTKITLRELTVAERLQIGQETVETPRLPAWLVARAAVAEDGKPLWPDVTRAEAILMGKGRAVQRLGEIVLELSGMTQAEETPGN